jgi:hypothetical protein
MNILFGSNATTTQRKNRLNSIKKAVFVFTTVLRIPPQVLVNRVYKKPVSLFQYTL